MQLLFLVATLVSAITCAMASPIRIVEAHQYPKFGVRYSGVSNDTISHWYSSVVVHSETNLTITVLGPHRGVVPSTTCTVSYYMLSNGSMVVPESFENPDSCYGHLRRGNNGVMNLTFSAEKDIIVLDVHAPATDVYMTPEPHSFPQGQYKGSYTQGPYWYSSVIIRTENLLDITVTGPHSGYVPHSTCKNVYYNMTSDGEMKMPESFNNHTGCIYYLRTGNNGVMTLTYSKNRNTILLGVADPSTDILMTPY